MKTRFPAFLAAFAAAALWTARADAAPGDLDTTFNGTGKAAALLPSGWTSQSYGVMTLSDGRILTVGVKFAPTPRQWLILAHNPDGTPDTTFGTGGYVTLSGNAAYDCVEGPNGTILVTGIASGDFTVVRLLANGALDTTFGTGGIATVNVSTNKKDKSDISMAMKLQSNGKIVVAGHVMGDGKATDKDFGVTRLNANGTLDATFGTNGSRVFRLSNSNDTVAAGAIAIDTLDRIIIGGVSNEGPNANEWTFIRVTAAGALDTTFGSSGKVSANYGFASQRMYGLATDSENRVLTVGRIYRDATYSYDALLSRYTDTGALDTTFSPDGFWISSEALEITQVQGADLAIQSDGKIVVTAEHYTTPTSAYDSQMVAFRVLSTGTTDTAYGSGGMSALVDFDAELRGGSPSADAPRAMALDANGNAVIAGYNTTGPNSVTVLGRLLP